MKRQGIDTESINYQKDKFLPRKYGQGKASFNRPWLQSVEDMSQMDTTINHYGTSTSKSNKNLKMNSTLRQEDRPRSNNDELLEYSTMDHTRNRKAA